MVADMDKKPGHRALRAGRISQQNGIYLVTFVTQKRQPIFRDFHLACAACRIFSISAQQVSATLLAWVLMPDHFHGLICLDGQHSLPRIIQRMKSMSSKACHVLQPNTVIWARAFHDHALRKDEDLHHAARYLITNPIRAGLVERIHEYPFWDAVWL